METSVVAHEATLQTDYAKDDTFLPARKVWERYGVTDMTLWRWLRDERMSFPQPMYLGRYRYWKLAELQDWERARLRPREAA